MSSTLNNTIFDQQKLTQAQVYAQFQALFLEQKGYLPTSGETWDMLMLFMATGVSNIQDVIIANNKNLTTTYAKGAYLDFIGKIYGVPRIIQAFATTFIQLTLYAGDSVTLYSGFTVATSSGLSFVLQNNVVLAAGQTTGTYLFEAFAPGESYNNIAIGQITDITTPSPYVTAATNTTISAGGLNYESDTDYISRLNDNKNYLSAAGNVNTYYLQLYENFPQVLNAYIIQPVITPGYVDIYVILPDGQFSDSTLKNAIKNYFQIYAPLTDTQNILDPTLIPITLNLIIHHNGITCEDSCALKAQIKAYYDQYIIGNNFYIATSIGMAMRYNNVTNATTSNTDVAVSTGEVIKITPNITFNPAITCTCS